MRQACSLSPLFLNSDIEKGISEVKEKLNNNNIGIKVGDAMMVIALQTILYN